MKTAIGDTLEDTKQISEYLKADSVRETCRRIWQFCYAHFQYKEDKARTEQIRRPTRSWWDRKQGIDCDCFSVFIGSVLTNLGIPFLLRMTKYQALDYEHIYPVALTANRNIILDCVVNRFDYQVPYTQKKDIIMELQYLNGIDNEDDSNEITSFFSNDLPIDAVDLFSSDELEGLEGKAERAAKKKKRKAKQRIRKADRIAKHGTLKERLAKGLHVINRANPATALIRIGILASMKLNVMQIASILRFAYWSDAEAVRNNMNMAKFNQLKKIREKMEKIFFGAGGKTINLKKAILTGKGNRNRMVQLNGLGEIIPNISDYDDLRVVLGDEIYFDEFEDVDASDLSGLGVATAAGVTAASGILATIKTILQKLGKLFKRGTKQAGQALLQENTENREEKVRKFSLKNLTLKLKDAFGKRKTDASTRDDTTADGQIIDDDTMTNRKSITTDNIDLDADSDKDDTDDKDKSGFINWVKEHPVATAGIATAIVGGTILAVKVIQKSKSKKGLAGVPKSKSKKKPKTSTKKKTTASKVKRVELL
ncbi:MAG: hypothetical protein JKY54_13950 [Flavobacteriales bacterium]|nr:hypothetical protein [Flavobacteriales bacterium]